MIGCSFKTVYTIVQERKAHQAFYLAGVWQREKSSLESVYFHWEVLLLSWEDPKCPGLSDKHPVHSCPSPTTSRPMCTAFQSGHIFPGRPQCTAAPCLKQEESDEIIALSCHNHLGQKHFAFKTLRLWLISITSQTFQIQTDTSSVRTTKFHKQLCRKYIKIYLKYC